jgi:hypothetical protein
VNFWFDAHLELDGYRRKPHSKSGKAVAGASLHSQPKEQEMSVQTIGTPLTDAVSWAQTLVLRVGIAMQSLVNEFVHNIQFVCNSTQATAAYEKVGLIVEGEQQDDSIYPQITKDAVAILGSVDIAGGIQKGRAWGHYAQAGCKTGSDGFMIASERGLNNNGSSESRLSQPTSKVVDCIVAGEGVGNNPVTAARVVVPGTSKFFRGDVFMRNAFVDQNNAAVSALLDADESPLYQLNSDGSMKAKSIAVKEFGFPFIDSPTIPQIPPGTMAMWGDTSTGQTKLLFFDGGFFFEFAPSAVTPK